jgi:hypothetical protein
MARVHFTLETPVPADEVLAAAIDFSDRRPDLWPNISRRLYTVHEVGDTWAEVTEGTNTMGGIWARERYDWSKPGVVRGTVQESNVFRPGGMWEIRVQPTITGGSRIELMRDRRGKGKGKFIESMLSIVGRKVLSSQLQQTLDILSREDSAQARDQRPRVDVMEQVPPTRPMEL